MVIVYWLVVVAAVATGGVFGYRHWRQRQLHRQLSAIQITSDLWRAVSIVPDAMLPAAVRTAVVSALKQAAERLAEGPFARYAATLKQQAVFVARGSANADAIPEVTAVRSGASRDTGSALRAMEHLLRQAAVIELISARESALAISSLRLAHELASVEWLVQEARRAMLLREKSRMEALKAQALAQCARLPAKTAEEVRKRVHAGLALT